MLQIIKSFLNQSIINSIIKIVFRVAPLYYISSFENSKIAFSNFMPKFSAFFNNIVFDDYNNFPKLRLGELVLTILYNLFISELLDDFYNFPKSELGVLVFNHLPTIYLSPNFLKEMLKREKFSKKVNFLSLGE